jgi:hypothetical protein
MSGVLKFLNDNSGAFTVVFTVVVAVATVFYAVLTWRLVKETERMRAAQTDPHVAVRIEPSDVWINLVMLVIENVGAGPAYDVKLSVTPDFTTANKQPLSELGMFKYGLPYMAPGQRVSHFLTSVTEDMPELEKADGRYRFTITARYRTAGGAQQESDYPIDFMQLIGLSTIGEPPLRDINKQLEKLAHSLAHIEGGFGRMKVDVYTETDRAEAKKEFLERRKRAIAEREAAQIQAQGVTPSADRLPTALAEGSATDLPGS